MVNTNDKSGWQSLFERQPGRVHIMGVCGEASRGMAWNLKVRGWEVTGCDTLVRPLAHEWLRVRGIEVFEGHDPAHVAGCDVVIYGHAIAPDNPELVAARAAGVLLVPRGKALAACVNGLRSVVVCGSLGKTTTACFTTRLLQLAGESPIWSLSGSTSTLGSNAGPAEPGTIMTDTDLTRSVLGRKIAIVEVDECDATLTDLSPALTIITGADLDNTGHFPTEQAFITAFNTAVSQTREGVAVCCESPEALQMATFSKNSCLTYGFMPDAVVRAIEIRETPVSVSFELLYRMKSLGRTTLLVPGMHNVLNALGAFCAGIFLGHDPQRLMQFLPEATCELPLRRFQWIEREAPVQILLDYSHHPIEVAAVMAFARPQAQKRLRVVFQPHRYSRTLALGKEFPQAMKPADEVIILPVFGDSEIPLEGGEEQDLYAHFRRQSPNQHVLLARSLEEVHHYINRTAETGDLIVIVGSGDVARLAKWLDEGFPLPLKELPAYTLLREMLPAEIDLKVKMCVDKLSYFRVGGMADVVVTVNDLQSLSALLMACHAHRISVRCIGAGSNSWFSDLGQPGVLFKLSPEGFGGFERKGTKVTVGAGWNGFALLNRLEEENLGGLEFLESVPGQVGGWVRMNAGAFGDELWNHLVSLRVLTSDGQARCVPVSEFQAGYRSVQGLSGLTVVETTFSLKKRPKEEIRAERDRIRANRQQFAGARTCGSVFKNLSGESPTGLLLDRLGAKSWRIGGAAVSPKHANVVTTDLTANASDVLALMKRMQYRIKSAYGLTIEPEVRGFDFQETLRI